MRPARSPREFCTLYRFVGRPPTRRRGLTCRRCKRGCASAARDVGEKLVGTPWERRGNRASIVGKDRTAPINTPGSVYASLPEVLYQLSSEGASRGCSRRFSQERARERAISHASAYSP